MADIFFFFALADSNSKGQRSRCLMAEGRASSKNENTLMLFPVPVHVMLIGTPHLYPYTRY